VTNILQSYLPSTTVSEATVLIAVYILCNCAGYLWNQWCDTDTDKYFEGKNPFVGLRPTTSIAVKFTIGGLALVALLVSLMLSVKLALSFALYLLLIGVYSAPQLRLKAKPIIDVLTVSMITFFPLAIVFVATGNYYESVVWLAVGASLLIGASHLLQSARDMNADKAAGLKTSAIFLGKTMSLGLAILLTLAGTGFTLLFFWKHTLIAWQHAKLDTFMLMVSFLLYLSALAPRLQRLTSIDLVSFEGEMRFSSYIVYVMLIVYSMLITPIQVLFL
jgi:4-hydroxybenzoate polyprenyltransferase